MTSEEQIAMLADALVRRVAEGDEIEVLTSSGGRVFTIVCREPEAPVDPLQAAFERERASFIAQRGAA